MYDADSYVCTVVQLMLTVVVRSQCSAAHWPWPRSKNNVDANKTSFLILSFRSFFFLSKLKPCQLYAIQKQKGLSKLKRGLPKISAMSGYFWMTRSIFLERYVPVHGERCYSCCFESKATSYSTTNLLAPLMLQCKATLKLFWRELKLCCHDWLRAFVTAPQVTGTIIVRKHIRI